MATRVYHMYGTSSSAANGVAYIDVTRAGIIRKVAWTLSGIPTATGEGSAWELDINNATTQRASHNCNGLVSECTQFLSFTTSGAISSQNFLDAGMAMVVKQGDRLYLHCGAKTGSQTATVTVNITVDE